MADNLPADLSKVDPADAWKPYTPSPAAPWNRKWVTHLYRRATFGATPAETEQAIKDGPAKTLDRIMTGRPDAAEMQELLTETGRFYTEPSQLRAWWLYAMVESGHPLREKLTLFWHNHFATSIAKVRFSNLMFEQNLTLRKHALGRFRPFLLDMSKDVAMLIWLDSNQNTNLAPNENYAREVMELFSLGVGNYTEKDIQEAARAFTGWHHSGAWYIPPKTNTEELTFQFNAGQHDNGSKTVFGKTGNWNGDDIIRFCCDHPACAKFLVGKLYAFLVSETAPPKGLLTPLEERFRKSDYDIADLVKAMLGSRLFYSEHAYRKRVKWPVEYALGTVRAVVPDRAPLGDLLDPLAKMGQVLFAPPNVKGWRTGTDWLNSATLLARNNFGESVAMGNWARLSVGGAKSGPQYAAVPVAEPTDVPPGVIGPATNQTPTPDSKLDVIPVLFATQPKTPAELVTRMAELLYGTDVPPKTRAKIEKFLTTPGPSPAPSKLLRGAEPPATKPSAPNMASDDFKARTREALHALMCLPEFQLG